jgi:hypothetical protein
MIRGRENPKVRLVSSSQRVGEAVLQRELKIISRARLHLHHHDIGSEFDLLAWTSAVRCTIWWVSNDRFDPFHCRECRVESVTRHGADDARSSNEHPGSWNS